MVKIEFDCCFFFNFFLYAFRRIENQVKTENVFCFSNQRIPNVGRTSQFGVLM